MFATPVLAQTNLVGYWSFDECSGSIVYDSSTYGNDGTMYSFDPTPVSEWKFENNVFDTYDINNGTRYNFTNGYVSGKVGTALEFDYSAEQFVDVGNDSSLNFETGDFSIEAWIKTSSDASQGILVKYDYSVDTGFLLLSENGYGYFAVYENTNGAHCSGTTALNDSEYHHIVGTRDGTVVTLYIDGNFECSDTDASTRNIGIENLMVGYYEWGNSFDGIIDEIRVYDFALSEKDVGRRYNDSVYAGWVSGKFGDCALEFDGLDDYVNMTNDTSLNFGTSDFSISLWMKLTNATKSMDILSKYSASTFYGYFVAITPTPSIDGFTLGTTDGDVDCSSPNEVFADVWYHVVYVVDQASITGKLYINNVLDTNASDTTAIGDVNNTDNLTIGISTYTPTFFNGTLDEVRLYSNTLSEREIENLYLENSLLRCGDLICDGDETKANCCIDCCEATGKTLTDIGAGLGSLFTGMGIPVALFIILLSVGTAIGLFLANIGRRVGAQI